MSNYALTVSFLLVALCGLAFGAGDQYLGSLIALGPLAWSVSGLSAPWLVLPFVAGWTAPGPRRAIALGLVAVLAALLGYFMMTVSPFEGVPAGRFASALLAMARANRLWVAGGLVTAPLYGLLGRQWRVRRSWGSAAALAGCVCLEPFARWAVDHPPASTPVSLAEVGVGLCLAGYVLAIRRRRQTPG
jgi:hypothetical protein